VTHCVSPGRLGAQELVDHHEQDFEQVVGKVDVVLGKLVLTVEP
jgi:hypothetical protein